MDYYGARYDDPNVGQFISADTVQGPNRYGYVGWNPEAFTDLTGQYYGEGEGGGGGEGDSNDGSFHGSGGGFGSDGVEGGGSGSSSPNIGDDTGYTYQSNNTDLGAQADTVEIEPDGTEIRQFKDGSEEVTKDGKTTTYKEGGSETDASIYAEQLDNEIKAQSSDNTDDASTNTAAKNIPKDPRNPPNKLTRGSSGT